MLIVDQYTIVIVRCIVKVMFRFVLNCQEDILVLR